MSKRELRALLEQNKGSQTATKDRSRRRAFTEQSQPRGMEQVAAEAAPDAQDGVETEMQQQLAELERQLERSQEENRIKDQLLRQANLAVEKAQEEAQQSGRELEKANYRAATAQEEARCSAGEIERLNCKLEHAEVHNELDVYRKLDALRLEHAEELRHERCQGERERERANDLISEMKIRFEKEKIELVTKLQSLESELAFEKEIKQRACRSPEGEDNVVIQQEAFRSWVPLDPLNSSHQPLVRGFCPADKILSDPIEK